MSEVDLELNVENDKALKALDTFEKEAGKAVDSVTKGFGALKAVAGAAVAYLGAREVVGFFADGIEAANAQQQAMAALGHQLELTGESSDKALTDFAAFADEMEKSTKYGDDLIISQLALAKSFGVSNDQAKKLVQAATELSAVNGDSLDANVKKLGMTLSGVTGKLDEQIPALKGLSKEAMAAGGAIEVVLQRLGGSAAAEIDTFAGATLQAENAFGNLKESFGKIIIENPALISAVKGVTEIFGELQAIVEENQVGIGDALTGSIKVLGVTMSASTEVVAFFVRGFQGLINVVNLAQAGLFEVVSLIALIPGVGEDTAEGLNALRDSTYEMAAETAEGFEQVNNGFDRMQGAIDGAVQKVFDADNKIAASGKKSQQQRSKAAQQAAADVKELEKARAEALKLEKDLTAEATDEVGKLSLKYKEQIDTIKKLNSEHVISDEKAADLRFKAEEALVFKIGELREKEAQRELEIARDNAAEERRLADEQRKHIEQLADSPLTFMVQRLEIDPSALSDFQEEIAGAAGILSSMSGGADGARKMLSSAAGAIGDAIVPGIGGAVAQITDMLAQGPEHTKQQIKAWVEAMPVLMEAVGESIPMVVEAFVDSMVNEGGAVRIAMAFAKVMFGEGIAKSVGRQIGVEVGTAFNADRIGKTIGDAVQNAFSNIAGELAQLPMNFKAGFVEVADFFRYDVPAAIKQPFEEFGRQFQNTLDSFDLPTIPTPAWIEDLKDALGNFKINLPGGGGGGKKGPVTGIPGSPFAVGGEVPPGFPNDTFAARLTSSERVLNPGDSADLKELGAFVKAQGSSGDALVALMAQMLQVMQQPLTPALLEFKMDQGTLGKGMLQLSRRNVRTTA